MGWCACPIIQYCLTLCDLKDHSPPGSSVHGIFQARILEWVVISFFRGYSWPRDWTWAFWIAARFFTISATRKAHSVVKSCPPLHATLPYASLFPRVCLDSCPLSWWCHPTLLFSVTPFLSCIQSFPTSGSCPMSWLCIRWPSYWSFSFSISPSNEYSGLVSFRINWVDPFAAQGTLKSLLQQHSSKASVLWFSSFTAQLSYPYVTGKNSFDNNSYVSVYMFFLFSLKVSSFNKAWAVSIP